mgnify:CR=1 FL=1
MSHRQSAQLGYLNNNVRYDECDALTQAVTQTIKMSNWIYIDAKAKLICKQLNKNPEYDRNVIFKTI